jgi:hypothetical protein
MLAGHGKPRPAESAEAEAAGEQARERATHHHAQDLPDQPVRERGLVAAAQVGEKGVTVRWR